MLRNLVSRPMGCDRSRSADKVGREYPFHRNRSRTMVRLATASAGGAYEAPRDNLCTSVPHKSGTDARLNEICGG